MGCAEVSAACQMKKDLLWPSSLHVLLIAAPQLKDAAMAADHGASDSKEGGKPNQGIKGGVHHRGSNCKRLFVSCMCAIAEKPFALWEPTKLQTA